MPKQKLVETVLIGSKAVEHHLGQVLGRPAGDEDYLTLKPIPGKDNIDGRGILDVYNFSRTIASINEVYTLKVSHSPWVIGNLHQWYKHLHDVRVLKDNGAQVVESLYKAAYRQWELRKGSKNVNLNKNKEDFFQTTVKRYYDHDSVHAAVAIGATPGFNKILVPGEEVKTSEKLFRMLPLREQAGLVFEEVMVLSLERDLIPLHFQGELIHKGIIYTSYSKQLRLLVTQYSKGWFARWIIENYFLVNKPPFDYHRMFMESDKKVLL